MREIERDRERERDGQRDRQRERDRERYRQRERTKDAGRVEALDLLRDEYLLPNGFMVQGKESGAGFRVSDLEIPSKDYSLETPSMRVEATERWIED